MDISKFASAVSAVVALFSFPSHLLFHDYIFLVFSAFMCIQLGLFFFFSLARVLTLVFAREKVGCFLMRVFFIKYILFFFLP